MIRRLKNLWYWSGVDVYSDRGKTVYKNLNSKEINQPAIIVNMSDPLEDFE